MRSWGCSWFRRDPLRESRRSRTPWSSLISIPCYAWNSDALLFHHGTLDAFLTHSGAQKIFKGVPNFDYNLPFSRSSAAHGCLSNLLWKTNNEKWENQKKYRIEEEKRSKIIKSKDSLKPIVYQHVV